MGRKGRIAGTATKTYTVGKIGELPEKPKHLRPEVAELWDRLMPLLPAGLLLAVDGGLIESLCTYAALWRKYTALLETLTPGTPEHRRLSQTANDAHTRYEKCVAELGLSPNSRARLRVSAPEENRNELEEFLRSGGAK